MGKEIERKFLVKGAAWRNSSKGLTVGAARAEYEYEIPAADAEAMLDDLAEKPLIEKIRYKISYAGLIWEIDEFMGDNAGLVVAEVELDSETQAISKPDWAGEEVTGDARYFNSSLCRQPFKQWRK